MPDADRFAPDQWCDGRAQESWPLVPFSVGPVACPGRELVLFITSTFLATLLERHELRFAGPPPLRGDWPLPAALDAFALRFHPVPRRVTAHGTG